MKRAHPLLAVLALLTVASTAGAQVIATNEQRQIFRLAARFFAGTDIMNAQIAELRAQLARCDGPASGRRAADNCSSRALTQARLNYLLMVGASLGDPDAAGAPPKPTINPTDASDYTSRLSYLRQQIQGTPAQRAVYALSNDRAELQIILHCERMKDRYYLGSYMTNAEMQAQMDAARTGKVKSDVNACIKDYEPKAIVANRKIAAEYCVQTTGYGYGPTATSQNTMRFDYCLNKRDMLQSMCRQELELQVAMNARKNPGSQHNPQMCPPLRPSMPELQAIESAPLVRTIADLPPMFFAPPDVVIPPGPQLPIPAGTVLRLKQQGSIDADFAELERMGHGNLQEALVIGGQTLIPQYSVAFFKTRVIGPGPRPDTVQIGFTIDQIQLDAAKWADIQSNELVFTVTKVPSFEGSVKFDTILPFTIGKGGSVAVPTTLPPQAPTTTATPAPRTPPRPAPAPAAPSPADVAARAARVQACVQKAIVDHPAGGLELSQAISACAQTK